MKIKLIKFRDDLIKPSRAHYNDAGIDCYAQEDITLEPMQSISYLKILDNGDTSIDDCIVENLHCNIFNGKDDDDYSDISLPLSDNLDDFYDDEGNQITWCRNIYFPMTTTPTLIKLGFGLEVPDGYMATIRPRSSMNAKGILTQIGTIDSGYRGEIKVVLINLTGKPFEIKKGDKICQIVIEPVVLADLVEDLGDERGEGGFGSTGR